MYVSRPPACCFIVTALALKSVRERIMLACATTHAHVGAGAHRHVHAGHHAPASLRRERLLHVAVSLLSSRHRRPCASCAGARSADQHLPCAVWTYSASPCCMAASEKLLGAREDALGASVEAHVLKPVRLGQFDVDI